MLVMTWLYGKGLIDDSICFMKLYNIKNLVLIVCEYGLKL